MWKEIDRSDIVVIQEIEENKNSVEDLDLYTERYLSKPDKNFLNKAHRYTHEVFNEFPKRSSILILGSGHSFFPNYFSVVYDKSFKIIALDLVLSASVGLYENISFIPGDFLEIAVPKVDYIFSSHTVEHFTRDQILNQLLPKCWNTTRYGFVFVVPYKDAWGTEARHKVFLNEHDELANQAKKYKLIHDNKELVLWFEHDYK